MKKYKCLVSTGRKFSASLAIREMQIKSTLRFHLTPVRMAVIKKTKTKKFWWGYRGEGTLTYCWWGYKLIWSSWKFVWRFLKKLKIELPCEPTIPLLGKYPKESKSITEILAHQCLVYCLLHYVQFLSYGISLGTH
jgi:hypothetical protein